MVKRRCGRQTEVKKEEASGISPCELIGQGEHKVGQQTKGIGSALVLTLYRNNNGLSLGIEQAVI